MKTLGFLALFLLAGLAVWMFGDSNSPYIPSSFTTSPELKEESTARRPETRHTPPARRNSGDRIAHVVAKGDTLHNLSKRYDTSIGDIQRDNRLQGNLIQLGQSLVIYPGKKTSPTPIPAPRAPQARPQTAQPKPVAKAPEKRKPQAIAKRKPTPATPKVVQREPAPVPPTSKPKATKPLSRKQLPKNTVMESAQIAIDIDDLNRVYLRKSDGTFAPAGSIIYGSNADKHGNEVKTITFRDLFGKETTISGDSTPEAAIRLALKNKK